MTWPAPAESCPSLEWHLHWHRLACCAELKAFSQLFNESTGFCVYIPFSLLLTCHLPTPNSGTPAIPSPACLWWLAISILHDALLCWLWDAKTRPGASYIMSPLVGGGGGRRDFSGIYCVGSQAVASGTLFSSVYSNKLEFFQLQWELYLDLRRKPACH